MGTRRDATRKAIERANAKVAAIPGAPAIATGRNISGEIGRWLARAGLIDFEVTPAPSDDRTSAGP